MTATFEAPSHPDELPPLHASSPDQQCWPPMPAFSLNTHVTQVLDAQHAAPHISADVKLLPVKPLHAMPLIGNFKGPVPLQCGEGGLIGTLDAPCPGKGPLPTHGVSPIQQPLALEYTHVTQARIVDRQAHQCTNNDCMDARTPFLSAFACTILGFPSF